MTVAETVTDTGHKVFNMNSLPDIRNVCSFCGRGIGDSEPLWRARMTSGDKTACHDCAVTSPGPQNVAHWAARPFRAGDFTGKVIYVTGGGYEFLPGAGERILNSRSISEGDLYSKCQGCGRLLGRSGLWPAGACSPECGRDARNQRRRARRQERECAQCGETFTPPRSDGRYCSPACRQKAYRRRTTATGRTAR